MQRPQTNSAVSSLTSGHSATTTSAMSTHSGHTSRGVPSSPARDTSQASHACLLAPRRAARAAWASSKRHEARSLPSVSEASTVGADTGLISGLAPRRPMSRSCFRVIKHNSTTLLLESQWLLRCVYGCARHQVAPAFLAFARLSMDGDYIEQSHFPLGHAPINPYLIVTQEGRGWLTRHPVNRIARD